MNQYQIESVKIKDLPMCLEALHQAFGVNCQRFGFTKENYPSCAAFLTLEDLVEAKNTGTHIYAAWVDGKIAGCVQLKRVRPDTYSFGRFAVLPEYQHMGIGRALVAFCRKKAALYGAGKMRLLMVYENEVLRHFYESCGFRLTETFRDDEHPFLCAIYEMDVTEKQ